MLILYTICSPENCQEQYDDKMSIFVVHVCFAYLPDQTQVSRKIYSRRSFEEDTYKKVFLLQAAHEIRGTEWSLLSKQFMNQRTAT
jgi:hypothetical protein